MTFENIVSSIDEESFWLCGKAGRQLSLRGFFIVIVRLSKKSFVGFIWRDDGDTHTRLIDLVAVESGHSAIEVKDSQMKPETPNASHATPHFWREMRMKTLQARQVDLSRLRRSRSAASRPKKARSARQEVDL